MSNLETPHRVAVVTGSVALGGATTFLCNFGGELARRHIPVQVHSFGSEHPLSLDFARLNVPVTLQKKGLIHEDRMAVILKRLAEFRPTVVIANLGEVSFEILRYVPSGVVRVVVAHADQSVVYNTIRPYAGHMDLLAAVSETIARKFKAMPEFGGLDVRYLHLGVPMPDDNHVPQRSFARPLKILYAGRIAREQKRVHLFPEISGALKSRSVPFHWTIAGEGPELEWLKGALSSDSPSQTISFAGPVPYSEMPALLGTHDLFLLASDYEGLPLTLLEAMGNGLVPVVSDLPSGIRELVDDTTGRRVSPETTGGYAEAIAWMHANREEMKALSSNARKRVWPEFSIPAMTDRWLNAFPKQPRADIPWPTRWKIHPMIRAEDSFRYSWAGRMIRRVLHRFRNS